jgi:hypothetical protein
MMSHEGNALRVADAILASVVSAGLSLASLAVGSAASQHSANMLFGAVPGVGSGYFIDFRARPSTYIGHTYIVYGRIDASGRLIETHYAGLIPFKQPWRGLPIQASVQQYIDDTRRARCRRPCGWPCSGYSTNTETIAPTRQGASEG